MSYVQDFEYGHNYVKSFHHTGTYFFNVTKLSENAMTFRRFISSPAARYKSKTVKGYKTIDSGSLSEKRMAKNNLKTLGTNCLICR